MKDKFKWIKFLIIASMCFAAGVLHGRLAASGYQLTIDWEKVQSVLSLIGHCLLVLSVVLTLYFYIISRRDVRHYLESLENDEEVSEDFDKKLNRRMDYLSVANNVWLVLSIFLWAVTLDLTPERFGFSILAFTSIIIAGLVNFFVLKLYSQFRGVDLPFLISVKEVKENILQQDEAELQANYKMCFDIVMTLNSLILPVLYLALAFLSQLTGQLQLVAFIIVAGIHFYILIANLKMSRRFYR